MKKILVLLILLPLLMAQQIIELDVDHLGITWNAITPIEGSVITYEIVLAPEGQPEAFFAVEEISEIQYDVYL